MRLLHTSDWHLGRSFHGHSTAQQLREVLGRLPGIVREQRVDVVAVAGDVFDHAAPAAELFDLLGWAIRGIRRAGADVVMISGNHDNAARLGFQAEWAALGGVHMLTGADGFRDPLVLSDEHGEVDFYGVPFLEPMLQRGLYPGERFRTHGALLARVMGEVDALAADRGNRSVVLSHCFAANVGSRDGEALDAQADEGARGGGGEPRGAGDGAREPDEIVRAEAADLVWDLTSGGVDLVPASVFARVDYAALGHLHGRSALAPHVRYSGAPLHFSFSEADRPRGAWLVELDGDGFAGAEWVALPVPRPLARLRGTLDELLTGDGFAAHETSWVEATLTDDVRPVDAMRRLRARFPFCARIEFAPPGRATETPRRYGARVIARSDTEVVEEFLRHVRDGAGADASERALVAEVLAEARADGGR